MVLASGVTAAAFVVFVLFGMPLLKPRIPEAWHLALELAPVPLFFLFLSILLWFSFHHPLGKIFREMRAFLAGRNYKKIFTKRIDELGVLSHFFNDVTRNLNRVSNIIAEEKRMSQEFSIGSDIQRKILPTTMPNIPGLSLFGNTRAASEVGGDSFDIISAGPNTFTYVGDVTGHGLPAALIMMMVNTLIRTYAEVYSSGYEIIVNTNRMLKSRIEARRFMTCVLLRWNTQEKRLYFTGAGHEHILLFHKNGGICEVRQTGGIALGMVPDISKIVREAVLPFEPGDSVILYSDGIIEAKNMEGEMFGLPRLKATVERYAGVGEPNEVFTNISKDFATFVGDQLQEDDITLIVVKAS